MDKIKIIYGVASFLMGATGSTMYLIGKHKGEKKIKDKVKENTNNLIGWQETKIKTSESLIKDGEENRKYYDRQPEWMNQVDELHIERCKTSLKEATKTKRDLEKLKEKIIDND